MAIRPEVVMLDAGDCCCALLMRQTASTMARGSGNSLERILLKGAGQGGDQRPRAFLG